MPSPADDPPMLQHDDLVGVQYRPDPLGHNYLGGVCDLAGQGLAEVPVGLRVERRERVVEQVDRRVLADRPRDGEPLLLPSRQVPAVLADVRAYALGETVGQVTELGYAQGALRLLLGALRAAVAYVVQQGA